MSKVKELVNCRLANVSCSQETAQWLGGISDELHGKLAEKGLVEARNTKTLATFLKAYKAEQEGVLKSRTIAKFDTSIKSIVAFFGNVPLWEVTPEQAALYRVSLVKSGYKEATVAKMVSIARQFFNTAKKRKLIVENPFQDVKTGSNVNRDRDHNVTQEETDHLINACSNAKQRRIVALRCYAGLRIPSELVGLRWSEVNWETERFVVHSPKTEHHGKSKRIVPIFNQLLPYLTEAWGSAPEGGDRIFPEIHDKKSMGSWIAKLANRAGVALWEKPFQNMRANCATDLRNIYPDHVCNARMGHTKEVADRHYMQITEEHFEKASQISSTENQRVDVTSLESTDNPKNCAAKSVAAYAGNGLQINDATNKKTVNCSVLQSTANVCETKNGQGRDRTADTRIFSPLLYLLSYLPLKYL